MPGDTRKLKFWGKVAFLGETMSYGCMSRKDQRIQELISNAVNSVPIPEVEVFDPKEALDDAVTLMRTLFEARLRHYVDSKEENVAFISSLAEFLTELYPRKGRRKRGPQSEAQKQAARENMTKLWSPGGKLYESRKLKEKSSKKK